MVMDTPDREALLDHLAAMFAYPTEGHDEVVLGGIAALASWRPSLAGTLETLATHVRRHSLAELEEAFTRTFDINPDCALETGWHLYGENYSRGSFLVEMRERMRTLGLAETAELPDHIAHVLMVLGRLPRTEAEELARGHVLPAISKMRENLPAERPHACALESVETVIRELFSISEELTVGKEDTPYLRELDVLPPGCQSACGGSMP